MKIVLRRLLLSVQIAVLVALAPTPSFAEDATPFSIGWDIAILRPLGGVRLLVGTLALVPTTVFYSFVLPFEGGLDAFREVADVLVREPASFVFRRPLGVDFGGE